MKKGGFRKRRGPRLIPIVIQGGSFYPDPTTKVQGNNPGGADEVVWVNCDQIEYTIVFDDPPGSPLQGDRNNILLPAYDGVHYGAAGPFRVKASGAGKFSYTITAVNFTGPPDEPDFDFG